MVRVLIADDDAIIREGLRMIIETQSDLSFLGAASDGKQAVEMCKELKPDVTMLDIRMPVMDGIAAAEEIIKEKYSVPLLLTTFDEPDLILRALKAGVNGYILKNSPADRILSAIRMIHTGGTVFQEDVLDFIRGRVSNHIKGTNLFEALLSPRELEIVALIAEGLSNKEICDKLYLSIGTVSQFLCSYWIS